MGSAIDFPGWVREATHPARSTAGEGGVRVREAQPLWRVPRATFHVKPGQSADVEAEFRLQEPIQQISGLSWLRKRRDRPLWA